MDDDPLDSVYSFVERAYVRLQAGDLLSRCLEDNSSDPIQSLVEGLVLAGPDSLDALREILSESIRRKSQIQDDLHQIMKDLEEGLHSYGLQVNLEIKDLALMSLSKIGILSLLQERSITDTNTQTECLQLMTNTRELIESLMTHLVLLNEIEQYLQDWLWGIACEITRQSTQTDSFYIS